MLQQRLFLFFSKIAFRALYNEVRVKHQLQVHVLRIQKKYGGIWKHKVDMVFTAFCVVSNLCNLIHSDCQSQKKHNFFFYEQLNGRNWTFNQLFSFAPDGHIHVHDIFFSNLSFFFFIGGREASKSVLESMEISIRQAAGSKKSNCI